MEHRGTLKQRPRTFRIEIRCISMVLHRNERKRRHERTKLSGFVRRINMVSGNTTVADIQGEEKKEHRSLSISVKKLAD